MLDNNTKKLIKATRELLDRLKSYYDQTSVLRDLESILIVLEEQAKEEQKKHDQELQDLWDNIGGDYY